MKRAAETELAELDIIHRFDFVAFPEYVDNPVGFFREKLGIEPWSEQAALIDAVGRWDRVLCRSGHKVGKSISCAGLALWWICTRPRARAILTAPAGHQIRNIIWGEELSRLYPRVRAALRGPTLPLDPFTGLRVPGGGQIIGISVAESENLAGISGANLLFIIDEASGFPDRLMEVIDGNSAGGSKIIGISNPTRTSGWFRRGFKSGVYDLHDTTQPPDVWRLIHISSERSPNIAWNDNGDPVPANDNALVPGIAKASWLAGMRRKYGPDYKNNAVYLVRACGEFPNQGTNNVFNEARLMQAHTRWRETPPKVNNEPLRIGVDVARFGGDQTTIQAVRGFYAWPIVALDNVDGWAVADAVVKLMRELRNEGEIVCVNIDGIGVGASVVDALYHSEAVKTSEMYVVDVNVASGSDWPHYVNLRAQLYFELADWLEHGALPKDDDLDDELGAHTYSLSSKNLKQIVPKDDVRKLLERSPDRSDALALAVYSTGAAHSVTTAGKRDTAALSDLGRHRGVKSRLKGY